jgi:hypothetical protein
LVVANGGQRSGAGRPRGAKNRRTLQAEEIAAKAAKEIAAALVSGEVMTLEQASAMSALDVLKHAMTLSIIKNDWQSASVYARDIAPYQFAKLTSSKVDATVRRSVEDMSDDELIEFAGGIGEEEDPDADSDGTSDAPEGQGELAIVHPIHEG